MLNDMMVLLPSYLQVIFLVNTNDTADLAYLERLLAANPQHYRKHHPITHTCSSCQYKGHYAPGVRTQSDRL
jgi:hypothetical protein